MKRTYTLGIIGVGRWGINYLRTFNELDNAEVRWICDSTENTLKKALTMLNNGIHIKTTTNYKDILEDKEVDAVAIVSPGSTHFSLAREVLQYEKHNISDSFDFKFNYCFIWM